MLFCNLCFKIVYVKFPFKSAFIFIGLVLKIFFGVYLNWYSLGVAFTIFISNIIGGVIGVKYFDEKKKAHKKV